MIAALQKGTWREVGVVLVVVFGVGSIAMLLAHVSPLVGFGALFDGAFGTPEEIAETLVQATNLLFPALGIALAFRAGLFNIGAEGQLILGGFAAGWLGAQVALPPYLAVPMVLLAGAGVLLISFELDEIFACADRVLVIANGAFVGSFERAAIDRGRIGALMAGHA